MTESTTALGTGPGNGIALSRRWRRFGLGDLSGHALMLAAAFGLIFLYTPILVLIVFSFNDNPVTTLPPS
jgi:hypothetical protein